MVPPLGAGATARDAALEALRRVDEAHGTLRDELHDLFTELPLPPRDRALALQLAAGTIRHRRTLRLLLSHLRGGHGREGAIQAPLRRILELGAFQLLFLDRVPDYAVVSEAARAARCTAHGRQADRAAGFVNAMLRSLRRIIVGRDPDGRPARDAIPHPEGGVVRLGAAVLPDPGAGFAAFLGAAYSFPDWLAARWLAVYGDRAEEICRWSNRRPRLFARARPPTAPEGESSRDRTSSRDRKVAVTPPAQDARALTAAAPGNEAARAAIDVSSLAPEQFEALLDSGALTIQDPAAMQAARALAPAPGESVLDLCASPGTKTTQIAEMKGDCGLIVACDRTEEKLAPLRQALAARGLRSVAACLPDALAAAAPPGGFDAALADVPCSNTGVLARRVEARWRLRPEDLEELPRLQLALLEQAARLVRPGGRAVYSTCSLQPEENEGVLRRFLKASPAWRLVRSDLLLPGPEHDGAFWALLHMESLV
ncbi:MAG: hypothetical protein FJ288_10130 [Planctomycetes bacterium]|nr:hypothetical protein [Planctomycetota bacterium]